MAVTYIVDRFLAVRLVRYSLASVVALLFDVAALYTLLQMGAPSVGASALAYGGGILVHWLISSRQVFSDRVAESGLERSKQKTLFVASAIVGLFVTSLVMTVGDFLSAPVMLAKALAVAASFTVTWALRAKMIFGVPIY